MPASLNISQTGEEHWPNQKKKKLRDEKAAHEVAAAVDGWVVVAVLEMTQLYVRLLRVLAATELNFLKKNLVVELEEQVLPVQLLQLLRLLLLIETEGEVAQQVVMDRQCNFQQDDQHFHRMNKTAQDGELLLQHEQEKVRWKKVQEGGAGRFCCCR